MSIGDNKIINPDQDADNNGDGAKVIGRVDYDQQYDTGAMWR